MSAIKRAYPSYSVVIPCYNVGDYVEEAVASALAQTHAPLEVVCVNDGSIDGTAKALERLQAAYPHLLKVITGPNAGACAARNKGQAVATGEWIQFLDADDLLHPSKVEAQLGLLDGSGGIDLVCGSYERLEQGTITTSVSGQSEDDWLNLILKRCGITSANLWRRRAVEAVGGWSEEWKSSQEYELMFRLLKSGASVGYDQSIRTTIRAREGSISNDFNVENRNRYIQLRSDVLAHLNAAGMLTGERREVALEAFFKMVRGLYPLDAQYALAHHRKTLPKGYVPPVSAFNGRAYVATYRLLGLRGAEWIRSITSTS